MQRHMLGWRSGRARDSHSVACVQAYSSLKRTEHGLKSIRYDGKAISVVEPGLYAKRFVDFMRREVFCGGHPREDGSVVSSAQG
jgi:hypothetical protein